MKTLLYYTVIAVSLVSCIRIDTGKNIEKKMSYRGVIREIYKDTRNHMATTFAIQTKTEDLEIDANVWPRSWEFAKVGDSVIKLADTLILTIKKNDTIEKQFKYDF